jgi:hypothetical protein
MKAVYKWIKIAVKNNTSYKISAYLQHESAKTVFINLNDNCTYKNVVSF